MANSKKAGFLKKELPLLSRNDQDHIGELVNSLYKVQNVGNLHEKQQNDKIPCFVKIKEEKGVLG